MRTPTLVAWIAGNAVGATVGTAITSYIARRRARELAQVNAYRMARAYVLGTRRGKDQ